MMMVDDVVMRGGDDVMMWVEVTGGNVRLRTSKQVPEEAGRVELCSSAGRLPRPPGTSWRSDPLPWHQHLNKQYK